MVHVLALCAVLKKQGCGPPEMVSCGSDGCVRVWDVRQEDQPVASFEPQKGSQVGRALITSSFATWSLLHSCGFLPALGQDKHVVWCNNLVSSML